MEESENCQAKGCTPRVYRLHRLCWSINHTDLKEYIQTRHAFVFRFQGEEIGCWSWENGGLAEKRWLLPIHGQSMLEQTFVFLVDIVLG